MDSSGQDKVKKICEALKSETLEPAKREAENVIHEAKKKAEQIIKEARDQGQMLIKDAQTKIQQEKATAESALKLAARQTIESLKQTVEKAFFNQELISLIDQDLKKPDMVAKLIEAIVKAIEKEGIGADLEAEIPKSVCAEDVNHALGKAIVDRLKEQGVVLGDIEGGAKVKIVGQHMTLDLSDQALRELLASYIRDDFRNLIFSA